MSSEAHNKIVIIGGGIAGGLAAETLQYSGDVTLIDPKEYFEITWASLRATVEPSFAEKTVFNHSEYLTNGKLIVSNVVDINQNEVTTADGQDVPYDYLIVASGHEDNYHKTRDERLKHYQAEFEKLNPANSVLIIGGGPSGVELAGEIAVDFPYKKITLVHNGTRLLEFVNRKASRMAHEWLISKNVQVLFGQSVYLNGITEGKNTTYRTSAGNKIVADCHFLCVGKPLSASWLRQTILSESLDIRGQLMVDENLRVKGQQNIFAIGDITDIPEIKQGYLAQEHAKVAAKNINLLMTNGDERKMAVYKPTKGKAVAVISLGRKDGIAQYPLVTVSGKVAGIMKSGDLYVDKTRKTMGVGSTK